MDQQPNRGAPPTPEEIARLEAEAVRAEAQRAAPGDTAPEPDPSDAPRVDDAPGDDAPKPDWSDVPYVDDVPAAPREKKAEDAGGDEDDDDYVPTETEKKIAAIPEDKWNLYTTLGGAGLGVLSILILTLGSEDLGTWALALAALIALMAPRYLERWWRRPMPRARTAMLIAMIASLAVVFVVTGLRTGFRFIDRP